MGKFDPTLALQGDGQKALALSSHYGRWSDKQVRYSYTALPAWANTEASLRSFLEDAQEGLNETLRKAPGVVLTEVRKQCELGSEALSHFRRVLDEFTDKTPYRMLAYAVLAIAAFYATGNLAWLWVRQEKIIHLLKDSLARHCLTPFCFGLDKHHTAACREAAKGKPAVKKEPSRWADDKKGRDRGRGRSKDHSRDRSRDRSQERDRRKKRDRSERSPDKAPRKSPRRDPKRR